VPVPPSSSLPLPLRFPPSCPPRRSHGGCAQCSSVCFPATPHSPSVFKCRVFFCEPTLFFSPRRNLTLSPHYSIPPPNPSSRYTRRASTPTPQPPPPPLAPWFLLRVRSHRDPPPWLPSVLGNGRTAVVPPRTGEAIAPGMPFSTRHVVPVVQRRSGLCCPRPVPHLHSNFHRGSPPRCCVFRARQLCTCGPLLIPLHSTLWPFGGATLWHCGRRSGAPPDAAAAQVSL